MNYTEMPALFSCAGDQLIGIVAIPETPTGTGVIIVVGGPQYRAGSHRQFVRLSRALAAAGYPVLRFDYRGMGDSEGRQRDFESVSEDIGAAIDALHHHVPAVRQVALWGLCDGASAALLYLDATRDARVGGLCLLNPWVRSEASLAKTQVKHYYTQRLRQKEFWQKLLSGKVAATAAMGLIHSIRAAFRRQSPAVAGDVAQPFQTRMALGWLGFKGSIVLILSGEDYTAREFVEYCGDDPAWSEALTQARVMRHEIVGADHTFSNDLDGSIVETRTIQMLPECGRPLT